MSPRCCRGAAYGLGTSQVSPHVCNSRLKTWAHRRCAAVCNSLQLSNLPRHGRTVTPHQLGVLYESAAEKSTPTPPSATKLRPPCSAGPRRRRNGCRCSCLAWTGCSRASAKADQRLKHPSTLHSPPEQVQTFSCAGEPSGTGRPSAQEKRSRTSNLQVRARSASWGGADGFQQL